MSEAKQDQEFLEPEYAKNEQKKHEYPWYLENIEKYLTPERKQAWAIRAYPCTDLGVWLVPFIVRSEACQDILSRLKAGDLFLDIGCHLGSDSRCLAFSSAPIFHTYGIDIVSHWDVGYNLYCDRGLFEAHFSEVDMLSDDGGLKLLEGNADVINLCAILHQWDWNGQIRAAKRVVDFSKVGTMVVGYQIGGLKGREVETAAVGVKNFKHDVETWKKLREKISSETSTEWEVKAWLRDWDYLGWDQADMRWLPPDARVLDFVLTRSK